MTLKVIGYIPLDASIHSIKTLALHENYMDIFELKIVFSGILQRDLSFSLSFDLSSALSTKQIYMTFRKRSKATF